MQNSFYQQERIRESSFSGESAERYAAKTFLLMFLGLLTTFGVAWLGYATRTILYVFSIPGVHLVLLIAELAVVLGMTAALPRISARTAAIFFFVYSVLNGIVFSAYFLIFELPSLILVFGASALYFGGMALFGWLTRIDLSRIRTILFGGLIFLIIANLLMLLLPGLRAGDQFVCTIGLVLFLAYTAYDTQKMRAIYQTYSGDAALLKKASIFCALQLYLDFVNLFLYLLRMMGRRKN